MSKSNVPSSEQMHDELAAEGIDIIEVEGGFTVRYSDACHLTPADRQQLEASLLAAWPGILSEVLGGAR